MFFTPVLQATGIRKFNRVVGNTAVTHKSVLHRSPDDIQSPQDTLLQSDPTELFQQGQAGSYDTYWPCSCTQFI